MKTFIAITDWTMGLGLTIELLLILILQSVPVFIVMEAAMTTAVTVSLIIENKIISLKKWDLKLKTAHSIQQ